MTISPYRFTKHVEDRLYEKSVDALEGSKETIMKEALENLEEQRFQIVNRVKKGKVQRRKKVSKQKGYTFRGGKFTKMSSRERMKRKVSQRRGAKKRKAKQSRSKRNTVRSMRLRKRTFGESSINEQASTKKLKAIFEEAIIASVGKFSNYVKGVTLNKTKTQYKLNIRLSSDVLRKFSSSEVKSKLAENKKLIEMFSKIMKGEASENVEWKGTGMKENKTSVTISFEGKIK